MVKNKDKLSPIFFLSGISRIKKYKKVLLSTVWNFCEKFQQTCWKFRSLHCGELLQRDVKGGLKKNIKDFHYARYPENRVEFNVDYDGNP